MVQPSKLKLTEDEYGYKVEYKVLEAVKFLVCDSKNESTTLKYAVASFTKCAYVDKIKTAYDALKESRFVYRKIEL